MKILVTGGCGFIGSHLVYKLISEGENVTVMDVKYNYSPPCAYIMASPREIPIIHNLPKYDLIYHLGMPSSSPMYRDNRHLVYKTIQDAVTLFEYCKKYNIPIIIASSSSVYNGNPIPFRENMTLIPTDFYTETRITIERLAKVYSDLYGLRALILRFFSVYGEREQHKGRYANIITQMIWSLIRKKVFYIYGDGEQTRDFIYVKDVVDALIKAKEFMELTDVKYDIFNVGTGINTSFNEVAKIIEKIAHRKLYLKYALVPIKNYVYHTLADTDKAEKILGFKAKTPLKKGIKKTYEYYVGIRDELENNIGFEG